MADKRDIETSGKFRTQVSPRQAPTRRVPIRKQNAISVTLTTDCLDTTRLNEISIKRPTNSDAGRQIKQPVVSVIEDDDDDDIDVIGVVGGAARRHVTPTSQQTQTAGGVQQTICQSADSMRRQTHSFVNNPSPNPPAKISINTNVNQSAALLSSSNLSVNANAIQRKSLIGRLERSSFQAQRLSDVGVAFGQQITAKMGLKLPASQERIVEQTRWLYLRYIFVKLRQNKLPLRDLNLTKSSRARRAAALGNQTPTTGTGAANSPFLSRVPATTSLSAPATASIHSNDLGQAPFNSANRQKRMTLADDLAGQQISMWAAAKMQNLAKRDPSSDSLFVPGALGGGGSFGSHDSSSTASQARRFVMDPAINNQIFSVILEINRELRDWKPEFYGDTIYELIGIDKFSSLDTLLDAQLTICQEMTRSEISWCRITALFSLFGAMSLDCVRLGAPEHVGPILDGFIAFVERDLALWISQQGGWEAFLYKYRASFRYGPMASKALVLTLPLLIWALLSLSKW